ncbi:MAG: 4Fe-4S dicluster domain-containing protein [bacterium]
MKKKRQIIEIDEEKCTGCGQCILSCAEGALELVDGKAKLVGEVYCDGLGACIGECPEGALKIIERESEDFDEEAVEELLEKKIEKGVAKETDPVGPAPLAGGCAGGCPGSAAISLKDAPTDTGSGGDGNATSELGHWPIKLQLLGPQATLAPQAPFLKGSDLVLLADCVAAAFPDLHKKILRGHTVAMGCPKLDDLEAHIERLADIIEGAELRSLTVAHMEVPCCHGFMHAAEQAIERAGVNIPLRRIVIGRRGEILKEEAA